MVDFVQCAKSALAPASCSVCVCGSKRPDDLSAFRDVAFEISRLESDILYCATAYDFEDAYFKKTSNLVDIKFVRNKYWPAVLPEIIESVVRLN